MGKRGPKPKPAAAKRLTGTLRKDRQRKAAARARPVLPPGVPVCPRVLDATAKRVWVRIVPHLEKLGVLSEVDADILARYCSAQATWEKFTREHQRRPWVEIYGQRQLNPAFKASQKANAEANHLAVMLRLDPASRAKLNPDETDALERAADKMKTAADAPADPAERFLFGTPKLVPPPTGTDKP